MFGQLMFIARTDNIGKNVKRSGATCRTLKGHHMRRWQRTQLQNAALNAKVVVKRSSLRWILQTLRGGLGDQYYPLRPEHVENLDPQRRGHEAWKADMATPVNPVPKCPTENRQLCGNGLEEGQCFNDLTHA